MDAPAYQNENLLYIFKSSKIAKDLVVKHFPDAHIQVVKTDNNVLQMALDAINKYKSQSRYEIVLVFNKFPDGTALKVGKIVEKMCPDKIITIE